MFTRPANVSDEAVADALAAGWGLHAEHIEYVAAGFGSFHWRVDTGGRPWFVSGDDLAAKPPNRLAAALTTARVLRDAGMEFVVAPERTTTGDVLQVVADEFVVAVYAYVEGETYSWGHYATHAERLEVLHLLVKIHGAGEALRAAALVDDYAIPSRAELVHAIADLGRPWTAGPFGEPARELLARHWSSVEQVLARYDRLVEVAQRRPERRVLTHGEPHRANTITTDHGVVLIDWDTALIAPPERDLWTLADEDPEIVDAYAAATRVTFDPELIELYRLGWDLTEIALYTCDFRRPHEETADTAAAWEGLQEYLDPDRWPFAPTRRDGSGAPSARC